MGWNKEGIKKKTESEKERERIIVNEKQELQELDLAYKDLSG